MKFSLIKTSLVFPVLGLVLAASPREVQAGCAHSKEKKRKGVVTKTCYETKVKKARTSVETTKGDNVTSTSYHPKTGKVLSVYRRRKGQNHGARKIYEGDGSGAILEEGTFDMNRKVGIHKEYYPTRKGGGLFRTYVYDKKGKEVGPTSRYFQDGGGVERASYDKPHFKGFKTANDYYETGDLRKASLERRDPRTTLKIEYFVSGDIKKVTCDPPDTSYLHTIKECQPHFPFKIATVGSKLK